MGTAPPSDRAPTRRAQVPAGTGHGQVGTFVLLFDEPPVLVGTLRPAGLTPPALLAQLLEATGAAQRRGFVGELVHGMGFDGLTYGRMSIVRGEPVPTAFCVSHGDGEWARRYFARRYHAVDPRLQAALKSALPYRWSVKSLLRNTNSDRKGESARKFLEAMRETGMRSGIMFAMLGPRSDERSIVSLSSRNDTCPDGDTLVERVLMLAMCLHEFYSSYAQWPREEAPMPTTLNEKQDRILQGLALGLTDREIAEALNLSMHGVDYHLRRLRAHFNARNRVELVQAAFRARSL
jgi:DNA-binding CsgD family transcriptional regulator